MGRWDAVGEGKHRKTRKSNMNWIKWSVTPPNNVRYDITFFRTSLFLFVRRIIRIFYYMRVQNEKNTKCHRVWFIQYVWVALYKSFLPCTKNTVRCTYILLRVVRSFCHMLYQTKFHSFPHAHTAQSNGMYKNSCEKHGKILFYEYKKSH